MKEALVRLPTDPHNPGCNPLIGERLGKAVGRTIRYGLGIIKDFASKVELVEKERIIRELDRMILDERMRDDQERVKVLEKYLGPS